MCIMFIICSSSYNFSGSVQLDINSFFSKLFGLNNRVELCSGLFPMTGAKTTVGKLWKQTSSVLILLRGYGPSVFNSLTTFNKNCTVASESNIISLSRRCCVTSRNRGYTSSLYPRSSFF